MKKFLQQPINFAYAAIVMMVLTFGVGLATASYTLPGEDPTPLIHAGGGEQPINNLKIGGSCMGLSCSIIGAFDARGLANAVAYFGDTGSNLFFGFGDMYNLGTLFIGMGNNSNGNLITASPQIAIWNAPVNGLSAPLQKVNVSGNVRAVNLNNSGGLPEVCVAKTGTLILCPLPNPIHGVCGPAEDSSHSSAPTTGLCDEGTPSTVTEGLDTWNWYCYGSNGGDTATCSAPKTVTYTYDWFITGWGPCNGASGLCSGTPTQGQGGKIDWNGVPFDWDDGLIYMHDHRTRASCTPWTGQPEFHSVVGRSFDFNASGASGSACFTDMFPPEGNYSWRGASSSPSYPNYVYYEPNLNEGKWQRITVKGGPVGMVASEILSVQLDNPLYETGQAYRARCDMNSSGHLNPAVPGFPSGGPVDEHGFCNLPGNPPSSNELQIGTWQAIPNQYCAPHRAGNHATNLNHPAQGPGAAGMNVPIPPAQNYPHLYMQGYACIDQGVISCGGLNQNQCNSISGCNWQGIPGTQTRIVECRNVQTGAPANENLCPQPKPPTSQPCG